jgi:hypothetical protein
VGNVNGDGLSVIFRLPLAVKGASDIAITIRNATIPTLIRLPAASSSAQRLFRDIRVVYFS